MRRGFKSEAEKIAATERAAIGLKPIEPIDACAYAHHRGVVVLDIAALKLPEKHRKQLVDMDCESWSGLTLKEGGRHFILVNPAHAPTRQVNTLMHELAHIYLRHVPSRVDLSKSGLMLLSDYPDQQEQEADWLAGVMLLPRVALIHYRSRGWVVEQICAKYGVSAQLCEWRIRMTGVEAQLKTPRTAIDPRDLRTGLDF